MHDHDISEVHQAGVAASFGPGMKNKRLTFGRQTTVACAALLLGSAMMSCRPRAPEDGIDRQSRPPAESGHDMKIGFLSSRPIGDPAADGLPAWITDLAIADLDQDGLKDVICCDARSNTIRWLRQTERGKYQETQIGAAVPGPSHLTVVDFDGDGALDVAVAGMGVIMPSNEKLGSVVLLHNDGAQHFINRTLVGQTHRVTGIDAADLNEDGRMDLAVAQFGYYEGQIQWLENLGDWRFSSHVLLGLAGAIHAPIADINRDGLPDMVALLSQDWEEVWAFDNRGRGAFANRVLAGSTNKDFGSSGICVADLDRDGAVDIVYTNGDGFDYSTPGARPWHGVQWLQNDGQGNFRPRRIGDFPGAFSPCVVDLDGDGAQDVVAVSAFNDWTDPDAASLICYHNDGRQGFAPRILARAPTHLVVVKAADMDDDGIYELVTGGFAFYPPYDRARRVVIWERSR